MVMKGVFMLFLCLGLGYGLCVVAKKQEGVLKTLGYTLGIAILALSFLYGLLAAELKCRAMDKMGGMVKMGPSAKACHMMGRK